LRSFQKKLPDFNARKIRVAAISVDPPDVSEHLRNVSGFSFLILCDDKDALIRSWDLVHPHGGEGGADIARPAEFILDSTGKVRWVKLTDDYLIRARPEEVLQAIDSLKLAGQPSD
jgi:peroxiredoxin